MPADMSSLHPPSRRRWRWLAVVLSVVVVAIGLAVWRRPRTLPPEPPSPELAEADPEVAEAIAAARDKVRQRPNDGAAWGRLGMVFRAHDFADEADRCFREAERLDPADARWPYLQGLTRVQTDPDAGIPCLQRAVERCRDVPLAPRLRLAETLLSRGRLDEAELHLEQARKAEPWDPRVQLDLGRLAVLRGRWRDALEHLDSCAGDVHARQLAHGLLAEVWIHLRQPDKAREEQRQAAQAPEDEMWPDPFVHDVLRLQRGLSVRLRQTRGLLARRQYPQAVESIEDTLRLYPRSTEARLLLAEIWMRQGDKQRAEQACLEAVRIDPESAEAWFRLGCFQALDRPRAAAESFRKTIHLKPDHADAHFNLGHRLKELGDTAGAADEFRAALRARPGFGRAREALQSLEKKK